MEAEVKHVQLIKGSTLAFVAIITSSIREESVGGFFANILERACLVGRLLFFLVASWLFLGCSSAFHRIWGVEDGCSRSLVFVVDSSIEVLFSCNSLSFLS